MAISYQGGTGLFDKVGPVVSLVNAIEAWEITNSSGNLEGNMVLLETELEDSKYFDKIAKDLMYVKWAGYKSALDAMKVRLSELTRLLMASEMVTAENLAQDDAPFLLNELVRMMIRDHAYVDSNTLTNPAITYGVGELSDTYLFGAICKDANTWDNDAVLMNNAQDDGRVRKQEYTLECLDNLVAGQENFELRGEKAFSIGSPSWDKRGSLGQLKPLSGVAGANLLRNGGFENITANQFADWSVTGLVYGSEILPENTIIFRGLRSCKITGTGEIGILSQIIPKSAFKQRTTYLMVIHARKSTGATISLDFKALGSHFGAAQGGTVGTIAEGGLSDSAFYTYIDAFNTTPYPLTDVVVSLAVGVTGSLYIDEVGIYELKPQVDGAKFFLIAGTEAAAPVADDVFSATIDNDYDGLFQTYFARFFGVLLPSSGSGDNIVDTLAA